MDRTLQCLGRALCEVSDWRDVLQWLDLELELPPALADVIPATHQGKGEERGEVNGSKPHLLVLVRLRSLCEGAPPDPDD